MAFKENRLNQNLYKDIIQAASEYMFYAGKVGRRLIKEVVLAKWNSPSIGWYKLNLDGSSLGNPRRASGGGLIRDSNGVWIKGFTCNIRTSSSVEVELWALRDGILMLFSQYCGFRDRSRCKSYFGLGFE